jgi:3-hydroxyisobutyrate dehydrogenase-like beta-hydroxyacid dehydrogenase
MNVGWIGTGKLGQPMAARIAASSIGVRAYVRSSERLEAIRARHVVCVTLEEIGAQNIEESTRNMRSVGESDSSRWRSRGNSWI